MTGTQSDGRDTSAPRTGAGGCVILIPALWLIVFFLVPFLIVLKISLSQTAIAQPPYVPVLDLAAGWAGIRDFIAGLSFDNYRMLGSDWLYLTSYLRSLAIAALSTVHPAADRLSDRLRHGAQRRGACSRSW